MVSSRMCSRGLSLSLLGCLLLSLCGCGDGRPAVVPAKGRVFINGEPLTGYLGFVRVEPVGTRAATGEISQADGSFTLTSFENGDGCVPGTHPVAVIVNTTVGEELVSLIPEHYSDSSTSGLEVTVSADAGELRIELEGELGRVRKPTSAELEADKTEL
jgi:hypothetical protein